MNIVYSNFKSVVNELNESSPIKDACASQKSVDARHFTTSLYFLRTYVIFANLSIENWIAA